MSSFKDKCQVLMDNHEDRRKMECFHEAINSTRRQKRKEKTDLGGVFKGFQSERRKGRFLRLYNSLHLETLGFILDKFGVYDLHSY